MFSRKFMLLAATSLVAAVGCSDKSTLGVAPLEEETGIFGLPVGEPVNVISATKGDGVSFDKFQVTFNNAEGTDITITTPEGEEINFTEDDLEWAGRDPNLGGIDIARLTSARGDRLDITLGTNYVMRTEDAEDAVYEEQEGEGGEIIEVCVERCAGDLMEVPVVAAARLDESDTREGFETYGVVGMETDVANLPRNQEDTEGAEYEEDQEGELVLDDDGNPICVAGSGCAGELAEGTAWYSGDFVASVSRRGENVSDTVHGSADVGIDFASNDVDIYLEGGYYADDVDDRQAGTNVTGTPSSGSFVTGVNSTDASAITSVTDNMTEVVGSTDTTTTEVVDGLNVGTTQVVASTSAPTTHIIDDGAFDRRIIIPPPPLPPIPIPITVPTPIDTDVVTSVTDNPTTVVNSVGVVPVDVVNGVTDNMVDVVGSTDTTSGDFLTGVSTTTGSAVTSIPTTWDNSNFYDVYLSGSGSSTDLDLGFDGSVQYTGLLDGYVEVPSDNAGVYSEWVDVGGTFGGAVFGAGAAATNNPGSFWSVVERTSTAGVFQADSGHEIDDGELVPIEDSAGVDITGGYIAAGDD